MTDVRTDLADRVATLERRLRIAVGAVVMSSGVTLVAVVGSVGSQAMATPAVDRRSEVIDVLRVRALDVVDQNGITRIKLASPLPAPIINGEPKKSRGGAPGDTMSGMLLFDAAGAERSGYATVDQGYSNVLLTLDDKRSEQHAMFITEPDGGTTLRLFNRDSKDRVDVAIDKNGPYISMIRGGTEIYRQPKR